ncbi:MAG: NUDIX domain-containing protein [Alphaproteobacteria bacterium]|nr:NUDIX domain-containing protein [Alphaproteobacteria bacterium]
MPYEFKKVSAVCLIEDNGKFLFVKRAHTGMADGFYMLPGGHVDQGESVLHATVRELKEELGIDVKEENLEFKLVEPIHTHITFFFKVKKYTGTPKNMEPEKHDEVEFLSPDHPLVHPFSRREISLIEQGVSFFPNDNFEL